MGSGKACLGDLWPTDEGMVVLGEDVANGTIWHVDDVGKGLDCGCICIRCRRKLVAKKGEARKQAHHFAHHADGYPDCAASGESLLHNYAKRIIERHRMISLPSVTLTDHRGKPRTACVERTVTLRDIRLEEMDGDVVPDIVAVQPDGRRIFIEVCNFHRCPPEKLRKLREMDVDVLEIYVSGHRGTLLAELDDVIVHTAPRKLLQCRAADVLQARLDGERLADESRKKAKADRLVAVYRDNRNHSHATAAGLAEEFIGYGFSEHLDLDDTLPSAFIVFRRQWQAAILFRLLDVNARNVVRVLDMLRRFSERNWIKRELEWLKSEESRQLTASGAPDFRSPYEEILGYLKKLEEAGVVMETRYGFAAQDAWLRQVSEAVDAEKRAAERLKEVEEVFADLSEIMTSIDGPLPSARQWLSSKADELHLTFDEFMKGLESGAEELIEDLRRLSKEVGSPTTDAPEHLVAEMGLPLETLMWRVRVEFYDRVERQQAASQRKS